MINTFLLSILPLVASSIDPGQYRQLRTREGRKTQEEEVEEYDWPAFRYVSYSELFNDDVSVALEFTADADPLSDFVSDNLIKALGYTEETWNSPGTAEIEQIAFSDLSDDQRTAAASLGFTEETWDCNQNHYVGYGWSDLQQYGLATYWAALGYNRARWEGLAGPPAAVDLLWAELNEAQQNAAEELCYVEETWNMVPLEEWFVSLPVRQDAFSDSTKGTAFSDLSDDQQTAATNLGFTEDNWDCHQNHYTGYAWSDLQEYELEVYWKELGYDEASWEGIADPPVASNLTWSELDEAQQDAAVALCFSEETWDEWETLPEKTIGTETELAIDPNGDEETGTTETATDTTEPTTAATDTTETTINNTENVEPVAKETLTGGGGIRSFGGRTRRN